MKSGHNNSRHEPPPRGSTETRFESLPGDPSTNNREFLILKPNFPCKGKPFSSTRGSTRKPFSGLGRAWLLGRRTTLSSNHVPATPRLKSSARSRLHGSLCKTQKWHASYQQNNRNLVSTKKPCYGCSGRNPATLTGFPAVACVERRSSGRLNRQWHNSGPNIAPVLERREVLASKKRFAR